MQNTSIATLVLVLALAATVSGETIAHWTFEEGIPGTVATGVDSILDSVGGHHATPIGTPTYQDAIGFGGMVGLEFTANDRTFIPDHPNFAITGSLTLEAVIKIRELGRYSLIFFRGDDRSGYDPYDLAMSPNGEVRFSIENAAHTYSRVISDPLPVGEMVHIAGTLDDATGLQCLYINGILVDSRITSVRPFGPLDAGRLPGLAIGSTQSGTWHDESFLGIIAEKSAFPTLRSIPASSLVAALSCGMSPQAAMATIMRR